MEGFCLHKFCYFSTTNFDELDAHQTTHEPGERNRSHLDFYDTCPTCGAERGKACTSWAGSYVGVHAARPMTYMGSYLR